MTKPAPVEDKARVVRCRKCKWAVILSASPLSGEGSGWKKLWEHMEHKHPRFLREVRAWARKK